MKHRRSVIRIFLGCVVCCGATAVEVAAQHGPNPQTMLAVVLVTKSVCDETIPGYAERYKEQHQKWVARNDELIRAITSAQYDGKTFGQFTEYVKAEFRKQTPVDRQKHCNQIVRLYSSHLSKRVFVMESLDRLAPWTSGALNGISYDGIDIWFMLAKDWNDNPIEGRPFPVHVCIGIKSVSKEELLTIRLEETELIMGGSRHRGKVRSSGPIYRWLRDSDDAEIVGPAQDASLKKGHYRCYEIVFDADTPTTGAHFSILLRDIRGGRGAILVPPVSFNVKEQP